MRRHDKEVTGTENILEILRGAEVMSVAMIDGEYPYVLNLNYGVIRDGENIALCFHAAGEGRKTDILKANPKVAVSIVSHYKTVKAETACKWSAQYASIFASGVAEFVTDESEKLHCFKQIMAQAGAVGEQVFVPSTLAKTTLVKLTLSEITAKKAL